MKAELTHGELLPVLSKQIAAFQQRLAEIKSLVDNGCLQEASEQFDDKLVNRIYANLKEGAKEEG
jgi:hypothetical protein